MLKTTLIVLVLVATFAKSQNCANTCRVVCDDEDNRTSPSFPRLAGPKGEKGDRGRSGQPGYPGMPAPTRRFNNLEERVVRLENFANKLPIKYRLTFCGSGMQERNVVTDDQITAFSFYKNKEEYLPYHARLFSNGNGHGWCSDETRGRASGQYYSNVWIQVDYRREMTLYGVVTQGSRHISKEWMSSYYVKYANGSGEFTTVMDSSGRQPKVFEGNTDNCTPKINNFAQPITAQIFRIYPIGWHVYPTMRFDFLTCEF